jgi:hypothetical protein
MNKQISIGVLDKDETHLQWLKGVGKTVTPKTIEVFEKLDEFLANPQLISIVNIDSLSPEEKAAFVSHNSTKHTHSILLASIWDQVVPQYFEKNQQFNTITLLSHKADLDLMEEDLRITLQKAAREQFFGTNPYFKEILAQEDILFTRSSQKNDILDKSRTFVEAQTSSGRFISLFTTIAEELLMNGIFAGGPKNRDMFNQGQDLKFEGDKALKVKFVASPQRLAISVKDSFGTLAPQTIYSTLSQYFQKGSYKPVTKATDKEGGLGFFMIFDFISHLIINIVPGRETETIALINTEKSFNNFIKQGKSFSIFIDNIDRK